MDKNGIVARKIAATFSSIGLTAVFLNPVDALHGRGDGDALAAPWAASSRSPWPT